MKSILNHSRVRLSIALNFLSTFHQKSRGRHLIRPQIQSSAINFVIKLWNADGQFHKVHSWIVTLEPAPISLIFNIHHENFAGGYEFDLRK